MVSEVNICPVSAHLLFFLEVYQSIRFLQKFRGIFKGGLNCTESVVALYMIVWLLDRIYHVSNDWV